MNFLFLPLLWNDIKSGASTSGSVMLVSRSQASNHNLSQITQPASFFSQHSQVQIHVHEAAVVVQRQGYRARISEVKMGFNSFIMKFASTQKAPNKFQCKCIEQIERMSGYRSIVENAGSVYTLVRSQLPYSVSCELHAATRI